MANNIIIGVGIAIFVGGMIAKHRVAASIGLGIIILGSFL